MAIPAAAITSVNVEAADGPIGGPFTLTAAFDLPQALSAATWQVEFVVDMAALKHTLPLGDTAPQDLPPGPNALSFAASGIDVANLLSHEVLNLGLLNAVLRSKDEGEVLRIGIVTKVYEQDSEIRRIFVAPS